jgi:hypothetical protein
MPATIHEPHQLASAGQLGCWQPDAQLRYALHAGSALHAFWIGATQAPFVASDAVTHVSQGSPLGGFTGEAAQSSVVHVDVHAPAVPFPPHSQARRALSNESRPAGWSAWQQEKQALCVAAAAHVAGDVGVPPSPEVTPAPPSAEATGPLRHAGAVQVTLTFPEASHWYDAPCRQSR